MEILNEPFLKKRIDKSKPQKNSFFGDPKNLFSEFEKMITFHFFTLNQVVKPYAWKVLVSDIDFDESLLKTEIFEYAQENDLISDILYLEKYDIELQYIVFNDNRNWALDNGPIYLVSFEIIENKRIDISFEVFEKYSFQKYIRFVQGQDMIMNKSLIFSTTELEGYYADICQSNNHPSGKAIFPGDVDLVLYNKNATISLIEFKKHTVFGEGIIEDQSFKKYWYKDKKKYQGLALLAKKLNKGYFYNIIYSTKKNELRKVKIEKISTELQLIEITIKSFENYKQAKEFMKKYIEGDR